MRRSRGTFLKLQPPEWSLRGAVGAKAKAGRAWCVLEAAGRWRGLDTASGQGGFVEDVIVEQEPQGEGVTYKVLGAGAGRGRVGARHAAKGEAGGDRTGAAERAFGVPRVK